MHCVMSTKEAGLSSDVLKTNQVLGQALGSPDVTRRKAQRMIAEQKFVYLGQTVDKRCFVFSGKRLFA